MERLLGDLCADSYLVDTRQTLEKNSIISNIPTKNHPNVFLTGGLSLMTAL